MFIIIFFLLFSIFFLLVSFFFFCFVPLLSHCRLLFFRSAVLFLFLAVLMSSSSLEILITIRSLKRERMLKSSMLPCSHTFCFICSPFLKFCHNVFVFYFVKFCSPVAFKNRLVLPCSLRDFANVSLFPKTLGKPSEESKNVIRKSVSISQFIQSHCAQACKVCTKHHGFKSESALLR